MIELSQRVMFGVPIITGLLAHPAAAKLITPSLLIDDPIPNLFVDELTFPVYQLRVRYDETNFLPPIPLEDNPQNKLSIEVIHIFENDAQEYGSVRELFGIDAAEPTLIDFQTVADPNIMSIHIARHMNYIAKRTRRGAGNVVVVSHDSLFPKIADFEKTKVINDQCIFARSSALKRDEMMIMYLAQPYVSPTSESRPLSITSAGIFDGPFRGEILSNGGVRAVRMENVSRALGNWKDYVSYFKIA